MNALLGEMRLYTGKKEIAKDLDMEEIDYEEDV